MTENIIDFRNSPVLYLFPSDRNVIVFIDLYVLCPFPCDSFQSVVFSCDTYVFKYSYSYAQLSLNVRTRQTLIIHGLQVDNFDDGHNLNE